MFIVNKFLFAPKRLYKSACLSVRLYVCNASAFWPTRSDLCRVYGFVDKNRHLKNTRIKAGFYQNTGLFWIFFQIWPDLPTLIQIVHDKVGATITEVDGIEDEQKMNIT